MKRKACVLGLVMAFALPAIIFARSFQVYPGARVEVIYEASQPEAATKMEKTPKVIVFTTDDSFENVMAFYRGFAREYRMPGSSGKPIRLPSGEELKEAYFIFDDARDIMSSKHWIRIQRPYLSRERTKEGLQGKYGAIRQLTAIIEEDKRSYP